MILALTSIAWHRTDVVNLLMMIEREMVDECKITTEEQTRVTVCFNLIIGGARGPCAYTRISVKKKTYPSPAAALA